MPPKKDGELSVLTIINDDRGRQTKAIARWEAQKAEWDRLQRGLARRVGKPTGSRTLQGSTHEYRMRTEELGMIDSSVPAEVKNGVSAWEMNLRASSGGVRYVQVGSSYPYPLYCPIRDAESVKPENHSLMRVIPAELPERNKPVSSGEYFQSRQHEFGKHIKRKFGHYTSSSFFGVEGVAPPLAEQPVPEDANVAPITFHAVDSKDGDAPADRGQPARDDGQYSQVPSRPLSAVVKAAAQQSASSGPMIVLSTAHLHFATVPGETAQATLRIENTGSTAVFYSWSACEGDAALPLSPSSQTAGTPTPNATTPDGLFKLSDVPNAVLLPEGVKHFTVSFRSPAPGIYSQLLELLTVPASRERIVIHLRAVVVGGEGDGALTSELEAELDSRAPAVDASAMVNEIVFAERANAFEEAAMRAEVDRRECDIAAVEAARETESARKRAAWEELNAALDIPWSASLYRRFEEVHSRLCEFLKQQKMPPAQGQAGSHNGSRSNTPAQPIAPSPPPAPSQEVPAIEDEEWSGGIRDMLEHASAIRNPTARAMILDAINSLVSAGKATSVCADEASTHEVDFGRLAWAAAGRQHLGHMADAVSAAASASRDIAEGRPTVKAGASSAAKGEKGKSAPPPKGKAPAAPETAAAESTPESTAVLALLAKRSLSDALSSMIDTRERQQSCVLRATAMPLKVSLAHNFDAAVNAPFDGDVEPFVDASAGKGKKK